MAESVHRLNVWYSPAGKPRISEMTLIGNGTAMASTKSASPEAGNPSMSACTISCIRPSIAPAVRRAENSEVASLR